MEQDLFLLVRDIYLLAEREEARLLRRFRLTPAAFHVLLRLEAGEGVATGDLAQRALLDNSKMTRVVAGLARRGWVRRRRDRVDRRVQRVYLTPAGAVVRDQARAAHAALQRARLEALDEVARARLRGLLARWRADYGAVPQTAG